MGNYDFYASSADVQRATDAVNRLNTTVMMNGFIDSMYNEEKLQGSGVLTLRSKMRQRPYGNAYRRTMKQTLR